MHYTIKRLLSGDRDLVGHYVAARQRWASILESADSRSVDLLSRRLTDEQGWFEHNCGGRWEGQEVMVWSGFGHLYDRQIGFDRNRELVFRMFDAFMSSFCSVEVKWHAERAADSYHLNDLREEDAGE